MPDPIGDIVKEVVKRIEGQQVLRLHSRTMLHFRRIMNDGAGPFLIAAVAIVAAAVLIRVAIHSIGQYNTGIRQEASALMGSDLEPRPSRTFPGMEAVLMSMLAGKASAECPIAVRALEKAQEIVRRVGEYRESTPHSTLAERSALVVELSNSILGDAEQFGGPIADEKSAQYRSWLSHLTEDVNWFLSRTSPLLDPVIRPGTDKSTRTREGSWGPMYARDRYTGSHRFQVLVPATEIIPDSGRLGRDAVARSEVLEAVVVALLVDDVWWAYERAAKDHCPEQLYFVSPYNVLGIWDKRNTDWKERFPPYRNWSAAYYVQRHITGALKEPNAPYVDYAGSGIVWTRSVPILMPKGPDPSEPDHTRERLAGVVAVDLQVPEGVLWPELRKSLFVHGFRVCMSERADQVHAIHDLDLIMSDSTAQRSCLSGHGRANAYEKGLMNWLNLALRDPEVASNAASAVVQLAAPPRLRGGLFAGIIGNPDPAVAFWVPLGQHRGSAGNQIHLAGLLLAPRDFVPERALGEAALASLAILLAFMFVVSAQAKAAQRNDLEDEMTLIRRLPVGIIVADSQDKLRGANQSAEQILGIPLPTQSDAGRGNDVAYATSNVFADRIVLPREDGSPDRIASYSAEVPRKRARGEGSTYFAELLQGTKKGTWVRLVAEPIPLARRSGAPHTFAAVQAVDGLTLEGIRAVLLQARGA